MNRRVQAQAAVEKLRHEFRFHCWLWMLAVFLSVPKTVCGQEALRQSLAGESAARAQKDAAASTGYYNLLLGDTSLRFASGLGAQYNDNIHLQDQGAQGDLIFTPNLNTQLHRPLTENNSLDFSMGAGYSTYLTHSDLDQFFVTPGSGIFFNLFIGDFAINLHDRVTITENGYQNPTANGNGNNATLNNAAGTSVTWDLNQVVLTAGYDHVNYASLGASSQSAPDSASDNLSLNAGVHVRPEIIVGVAGGVSQIDYDQSGSTTSPNSKQWSVGGFSRLQISEYLNAQLDAGYNELLPDNTSTNLNTTDLSGLYFDLGISHRVNRFLTYSLSAGRSQDLQSYGQPFTTLFVRWTPNWNFIKGYTFSTPVWWLQGTQNYTQANTSNTYDQYGCGLNLGRQLTQKLSSTFSYQFIQETSDQANLNYVVNLISLNFTYQF
ncbi:MAG TPA: hypothetical protein VNN22_09585 [Verrucomicrobiae bacterium]|nr:hypothetical protein [Verrucomicrobiae bacterium]